MTQNLTLEQIKYLKSLESKKKRRKFLLDCLVENVIGESVKFVDSPNANNKEHFQEIRDKINKSLASSLLNGGLFTTTTAPRTFEGLGIPDLIKKTNEGCKRDGKKFFKEKHGFRTNDLVFITDSNGVRKSGYIQKPEKENEFEVILCDITWEPLLCDNLTVCNFDYLEKKYTE